MLRCTRFKVDDDDDVFLLNIDLGPTTRGGNYPIIACHHAWHCITGAAAWVLFWGMGGRGIAVCTKSG